MIHVYQKPLLNNLQFHVAMNSDTAIQFLQRAHAEQEIIGHLLNYEKSLVETRDALSLPSTRLFSEKKPE